MPIPMTIAGQTFQKLFSDLQNLHLVLGVKTTAPVAGDVSAVNLHGRFALFLQNWG